MKLRKWMPGALAVVLLGTSIGCSPSAIAADGEKLIDKDFEQSLIKHFQNRFFNRVDATTEQRQKLSEIIAKRTEQTRPLREQVRHKALEVSDLMASANASDEAIMSKTQELRDLRVKLMEERANSLLQVRAVLTPEQRQKVGQIVSGRITGWSKRLPVL